MMGEAGSPIAYEYGDGAPDDAFRLGFGETPELPRKPVFIAHDLTLEVHAPEESPRFDVAPAMVGSGADGVLEMTEAMRLFVDGLIQRREIDLGSAKSLLTDIETKDSARMTHSVVAEGGKMVLKRNHFSCGCCRDLVDRSGSFS